MKPSAVIVTVTPDTQEMEELLFSLGYDCAGVILQNRGRPEPQFFLGRGKLAEVRAAARAAGAELVVVNDNLKPNQIFNMTDFLNEPTLDEDVVAEAARAAQRGRFGADAGLDHDLVSVLDDLDLGDGGGAGGDDAANGGGSGASGAARRRGRRARSGSGRRDDDAPRIEVFDRLRVILEIFRERARSQEARLQVDLAKLQYEMPIVKEYIHLAKKGEHPGFLAGGEYEVNQYYDMMKKRIAKIRRDLDRISQERDVRRKHRRKSGFHLVSLAGYTNAGKSSLLRALSAPLVQDGDRNGDATRLGRNADAPPASGHGTSGHGTTGQTASVANADADGATAAEASAADAGNTGSPASNPSAGSTTSSDVTGDRAGLGAGLGASVDAAGNAGARPHGDVGDSDGPASRTRHAPPRLTDANRHYRGEDILIENRYFSTLQTRTRRAGSGKREILVTDTVGFIDHLPTWVVEAFHSTLEEIALADVILLVADASDPLEEITRKLRTSLGTLWEFDGAITRGERRMRRAAARALAAPSPPSRREAHVRSGDDESDHGERDDGSSDSGAAPWASRAAGVDAGAVTAASGGASGAASGGASGAASVTRSASVLEQRVEELYSFDLTRGPGGLAPILVVLNKVDLLSESDLESKVRALQAEGLMGENWVGVSARQREGLDSLYEALYRALPEYDEYELAVPPSPEGESFIAWVFENGDVLDLTRGNEAHLHFEAKATLRSEVDRRLAACGAIHLKEVSRHDSPQ